MYTMEPPVVVRKNNSIKFFSVRGLKSYGSEQWQIYKLYNLLFPEKTSYFMPDMVREFIATEKRLPTSSDICDDICIGKWCQVVRHLYRRDTLSFGILSRMNQIPEWYWGAEREAQEEFYDYLMVSKRIPYPTEHFNGWAVGAWWKQQMDKRQ